jgi:hypothetical protein
MEETLNVFVGNCNDGRQQLVLHVLDIASLLMYFSLLSASLRMAEEGRNM